MNDAMRDYWNGDAGRAWVRMQQRMDAALAPVTTALEKAAAVRAGENVLDVGCGTGATTLVLAAAAQPGGSALGVDISATLLGLARSRVLAASFVEADAASFAGSSRFDAVVSRFGVMFFDDAVAAFANLHRLAAPAGRLVFACWRSPLDNGWATLPLQALAGLLP